MPFNNVSMIAEGIFMLHSISVSDLVIPMALRRNLVAPGVGPNFLCPEGHQRENLRAHGFRSNLKARAFKIYSFIQFILHSDFDRLFDCKKWGASRQRNGDIYGGGIFNSLFLCLEANLPDVLS